MTYREISDNGKQQELEALRQRVCELEQLVEHLQAQKQRLSMFETLVEHSIDGITMTDIRGAPLYVNPAMQRLGSYSSAMQHSSSERNVKQFFAADEQPRIEQEIMPYLLAHGYWHGHLATVYPDGSRHLLDTSFFVVKDATGEPAEVAGFTCDTRAHDEAEPQEAKPTAQADQQTEQIAALPLFQALAHNALDGIAVINLEGRITYANPAFLAMLNCSEDMRGWHIGDMLAERQVSPAQMIKQIMAQRSWQGVLMFQRKHSSSFKGQVSATVLYDEAGHPQAIASIIRDITEQVALAESLHQHQAMLQGILDNSPAALYVKDLHGRYLLVNQYMAGAQNRSSSEIVGKADYELFPADAVVVWREHEHQVIASRLPVIQETATPHINETRIYIESKFPIFDSKGRIIAIGGISTDITERKKAEEALRQNQALLQAVIDNSPAVIYVKDTEGRYIIVNHHHAALLRRGREEIIGSTDYDLFPARYAQGWYATDQQILSTSTPVQVEEIVPLDDGLHTFLTMKFPIHDERQNIYAIAGIVTDITERKQVEEALRRAHVEVEQRIQQRTAQLGETNRALESEIMERKAIEEALQQSEHFSRGILDALSAHIAVLDETGKIVVVNQAWRDFATDNPPVRTNVFEEANYLNVCDTAMGNFSEEAAPFAAAVRAVLAGSHERLSIEYPCHSPDEQRWFIGWVTSFTSGSTRYVVVAHENITARKLAEIALSESEEKFHTFFEQSRDGLTLVDEQGKVVEWNQGIEQILGMQREQVRGMFIWDVLSLAVSTDVTLAPSNEHSQDDLNDLLKSRERLSQPIEIERTIQHTDGTLHTVQTLIFPIRTNHTTYVGSITRDITRQRQTEASLRESEERYRAISELMSDFAYAFRVEPDGSLSCEWITRSHEEITDLTAENINQSRDWRMYIHPDDIPVAEAGYQTMLSGQPDSREFRIIIREGDVRWMRSRSQSVWDEAQQRVVRFYGAVQDITAQKQAEDQVYYHIQHLSALRQIDMAIISSLDLRLTLNILLEHVTFQFKVAAATVMLLDPDTHMLHHAANNGFRSNAIQHHSLRLGECGAGRAVLERRPIIVPNVHTSEIECARLDILKQEGLSSYYGIPLIAKGQIKGVLELFHQASIELEPEQQNFLEMLVSQAAIAIENIQLINSLQQSNETLTRAYDATIEGWARTLQLRDPNTEEHNWRMVEMTLRLCKMLDIPESEQVHMRRGVILHDIGKIVLPDSILLKPGPLSESEWELMRQHPTSAYDLLATIPFLRPALHIPYCHHERWNGSGYPRGLCHEEIPLAARIFAVVDVWDALSSQRPYRDAWPQEQVWSYLQANAGILFDPRIVVAFLLLLQEDR